MRKPATKNRLILSIFLSTKSPVKYLAQIPRSQPFSHRQHTRHPQIIISLPIQQACRRKLSSLWMPIGAKNNIPHGEKC